MRQMLHWTSTVHPRGSVESGGIVCKPARINRAANGVAPYVSQVAAQSQRRLAKPIEPIGQSPLS
jgi:hypothetical protein